MCKILNEQEVKPHKVRYYLERRDPEFKQKMAEVLCVYREVKLIKETAAAAKQEPSDAVAIVSYDEKTGLSEILCAGPGFHQVLTKRSPNMMANWVLASAHSRGGIFHC